MPIVIVFITFWPLLLLLRSDVPVWATVGMQFIWLWVVGQAMKDVERDRRQ